METTSLRVEGVVCTPGTFDFAALAALPDQIADVGTLIPGRQGGGVRLRVLLDAVAPLAQATHLTLHASDGSYSASVPLDAVRDRGIVAYRLGDAPLPATQGGPLRFYIAGVEECAVGEVDACANVKFLSVLQLTSGRGADTRPTTTQEHTVLHEQEGHKHLP
jgi:2-dehydropantoate 2-reductase